MVKEMHFGLHDMLNDLAYYEVRYLIDKFTEEVKEKNKQNEDEKSNMESEMRTMRANMSKTQQQAQPNYTAPTFNMPKFN